MAAVDHDGDQLARLLRRHPQLDLPVVQQQPRAGLGGIDQFGIRREDAAGPAFLLPGAEPELVSGDELERMAARQPADANLRPTQVLHDRHVAPRSCRRLAHQTKRRGV
jgi:hypothetical protein